MKKLLALVLVCALALTFAACSMSPAGSQSTGSEAPAKAEGEKIKIGFTVQDLANPYFVSVTNGMKDVCDDLNIELTIHDGKSDVMTQITAIENFVAQGMDAIIICPIEEVAPEAAVKAANDAGIPVISLAQYVNGSSAYIRLNEKQYGEVGGTIAGEWIKENLANEADAKVLVLGNPELKALIERANGLKEGILAQAPGANIVSEQAASTPEVGLSVAENALLKNPDINVVVACNDSAALGAYEAFVAAGKKPGEVCIVGLDATEEALKKISEETMFVGTVDVAPYLQGPLCLETALKVIKEGALSEDIYVDFVPVTTKNIAEYVK